MSGRTGDLEMRGDLVAYLLGDLPGDLDLSDLVGDNDLAGDMARTGDNDFNDALEILDGDLSGVLDLRGAEDLTGDALTGVIDLLSRRP